MPSLASAGPRKVVTAIIAVAVLLGVGMVTYFSGGLLKDGAEETPKAVAELRLEKAPPAAPLQMVAELRLPWNAEDGVAPHEEGLSSLETVFGGEGGTIYVVDHPPGRPGARVRWYRDGRLAGKHQAPGGSTLFVADGSRLLYIVAKGQSDSERLVSVDTSSGDEQVFTVPLRINSGPIVVLEETVYVSAWSGFVDPETRATTGEDILVPVADSGRQLTDDEAREGTVDAWRVGSDRSLWRHRVTLSPDAAAQDASSRELERGPGRLRIPYSALPLGVDGEGRAWVFAPPTQVQERLVPGWPARADEAGVILAVSIDGDVAGAMPLPVPAGAFWPDISLSRRIGFDGRFLAAADMLEDAVLVTMYEVRK